VRDPAVQARPNTGLNDSNGTPNGLGLVATDVAISGDEVAFIASNSLTNGSQVFLYNMVSKVLTQQTFYYSEKGNLSVDPTGRSIWDDTVFPYKSIFTNLE
jgi:hypothetical protein